MSSDTLITIQEKRNARLRGDTAERRRLQNVFRAKAKLDCENFYDNLAVSAEEALHKRDLKTTYRIINKFKNKNKQSSTQINTLRKSDGSRCSNDQEILERWKEHFNSALNHPPASPSPYLPSEVLTNDSLALPLISTDAPTLDEIARAVTKIKLGRAAGVDDISPELLKCAAHPICSFLHILFSRIWSSGTVPSDWTQGIILALYKGKGHKDECSSYRPITLLSVPGKVFAHVILSRIESLLLLHRRPQQSGFTPSPLPPTPFSHFGFYLNSIGSLLIHCM